MKKEISLAEAAQELQLSKTTISRALFRKRKDRERDTGSYCAFP